MSQPNAWAKQMAAMFAFANTQAARQAITITAISAALDAARQRLAEAERVHLHNHQAWQQANDNVAAVLTAGPPQSVHLKRIFAGVLLVLGLVLGLFVNGFLLLLMIIPAVGLFMWATSDVTGWNTSVAKLNAELNELGRTASGSKAVLDASREEIQSLEFRDSQLELGSPLAVLGQVWLPLRVARVGGYTALVDESGCVEPTQIALPELPDSAEVLSRVDKAIQAADARPMLLAASSSDRAPADPGKLHGEERQLAEAMQEFQVMIDGAAVHQAEVRLVAKDDALAQLARATPANLQPAGPLLRTGGDARSAAAGLTSVLGRSRTAGSNARDRLARAASDLKRAAYQLGSLRESAVRCTHTAVSEVVSRSYYVHSSFYCPKCNQIPAYLFHRLGLDEETVHEVDMTQLHRAISRDPEASARVDREPELLDEFDRLVRKLQELRVTLRTLQAEYERLQGVETSTLSVLRMHELSLRAILSECGKHELQVRACVRRIVTGEIRPITELSKQASLVLDPTCGSWSCASCNTKFEDPAVVRMGEVLRVRDELMGPMWNHLWTEKADFCRSELFRSNEQVSNLVEREAAAMRDIAEQYRADMRPVRENLILSVTSALQGREKLESTQMSLVALGVSSPAEVAKGRAALTEMTGGGLDDMRKRAEAKEDILVQLPAGQIVQRPSLRDPIEEQKDPTEVFHRRHIIRAPSLPPDISEVL